MCLIRIEQETDGFIPTERLVAIRRVDGKDEKVYVSSSSIEQGQLRVGLIQKVGDQILIELPRESTTGRWRIRVPEANVELTQLTSAAR